MQSSVVTFSQNGSGQPSVVVVQYDLKSLNGYDINAAEGC